MPIRGSTTRSRLFAAPLRLAAPGGLEFEVKYCVEFDYAYIEAYMEVERSC